MNWQWRVWIIMMADWSDLPSLTLFKGGADNFWAMGKVTIESDDWILYST